MFHESSATQVQKKKTLMINGLPIKWPFTICYPYYRLLVKLLWVLFQHSSREQKYFGNLKSKSDSIERGEEEDSEYVKILHKSFLVLSQNPTQR